MKSYETLEHTADLRIRAAGKTLKALFVNALAGMMAYLKDLPREADLPPAAKMIRRVVKISSPDLNALLVDFLSEALTLADTNREIYREAEFLKLAPYQPQKNQREENDQSRKAIQSKENQELQKNMARFGAGFPGLSVDSVQKQTSVFDLEARLFGEKVKWFDRDIKAVTYYGLNIKQNKEGFWEATIVFDI